jgi:hypothetical protein
MNLLEELAPIVIFSTVPGALGGVGTFLFSIKKGHYKNNKYMSADKKIYGNLKEFGQERRGRDRGAPSRSLARP